jgi:hypothetical protein
MIYYAGIGSRETPENVLKIMEQLGKIFAKKNFILRSGAAEGADRAFEKGCDEAKGQKEIYLPWKNFNGSESDLFYENLPAAAEEIAFKYHPNLYKCTYGVIKMMTRNSCQILGKDCHTKCNFVVCYCAIDSNGNETGGTSQALRIARDKNIPIFNLFYKEELNKLKEYIKGLEIASNSK